MGAVVSTFQNRAFLHFTLCAHFSQVFTRRAFSSSFCKRCERWQAAGAQRFAQQRAFCCDFELRAALLFKPGFDLCFDLHATCFRDGFRARFLWEKTTKKQSLGVLLAFFGVALSVGSASFDLGSFLAVLDGFLWSVGTLYHQKRLVNSNLLQLNAFMTLFSALIVSPTLLLNHSFVLTRESLLLSLLVPLSAQTLGFLFWFNAVNRLGAIRASSLSLLVPISAYLLSFALLGKTPTKFELVGSAITLIGVYFTQRG
ncbi:hypothetical protein B9P99_02900 [Candidatus Marsarchaeota G1 archaeon OSP_B]|uniref:EamA domain-containing protein n=2 Tax=Candidatus Marsarchaeota group 1 TaxID=2203770 RepID=A0A2R6ANU0_9ARCH|nr:MAG: hypothetical protein B9Q00_07090 [Candidatus Marsarchaeota G1 archaeon OSP_C]PSN93005.1 MAG: hypothetical protein B9P99_02900 [Candidatus Marsarchaeota G1 archaeon OSP_B]